jgi:FSR family fosmidomycin resistance protein-like MFS transporter
VNKPVLIEQNTVVVEKDANAALPLAPSYVVLLSLCLSHFLNDLMQSLMPAVYPLLKESYSLDFVQIGLITMAFQFTSSIFQPLVGLYTDRRPLPYSLPIGMASTFCGLILLANAHAYWTILVAAALVGLGSAVFHPEAVRVARLASGGRLSFAQSVFQVGGNSGSAVGPLLAALIIVPWGQGAIAWFSMVAALTMAILFFVSRWYKPRVRPRKAGVSMIAIEHGLSHRRVVWAIAILVLILVSKTIYLTSFSSYYMFYLMEKFGVSTQSAQVFLFIFLASGAVGILLGGHFGDRFSRKHVIWFSVVGALPFALAVPFANLIWTAILSGLASMILNCAAAGITVQAQELLPRHIGAISGVFYGLAFGVGGLGAAALGLVADAHGIDFVYTICAFLPLLGFVAVFLPNMARPKRA